jgi:hypothetical protein
MQKGSWVIRPVVVDIAVGEPVQTTGMSAGDRDALISVVRARIEGLLRKLAA